MSRAIQLIIILVLSLSTLAGGAPVVSIPQADLPSDPRWQEYAALSTRAEQAAWRADLPAADAQLAVLVQLRLPPLALVAPADQVAATATIAAAQDRLSGLIQAEGGHVLAGLYTATAGLAARVDGDLLAVLRAHPDVLAVLPISDYATAQTSSEEALTLAQVNALVGSSEVRRLFGNDGRNVDIAVVDSGVDYTHRKLGGPGTPESYLRAYCGGALLQPGDAACNPALDPPLDLFPNNKVLGGYDYLGDVWPAPDPRCFEGPVCAFPDRNPIDGSGHGTHVADIAAGRPLSADGSDSGIAPGANIWAFKACNGAAELCEGTALLLALDHALDLDGSNRGRCRADLGQVCAAYDPADIIVLSVGYAYGQPEDALTLMADLAGYYGALVVAAAGNDGDVPYVIATPASADASLAVAESNLVELLTPAVTAAARPLNARLQAWSPPLESGVRGELRLGDGAGANLDGCAPLPAWDGALLLLRGGCSSAAKARYAADAGATLVLIADRGRAALPPTLYGSFSRIPVLSLTQQDAEALLADAADSPLTIALDPATEPGEQVALTSSRGPRLNDSALKPDLSAPGAIFSAAVGSGTEVAAFGGSSGSAPVVAGAAALIVYELERRGLIDPGPGLRDPDPGALSLAPLIKALLMNTAASGLTLPDGSPAPASARGSGRVDALAAVRGRTIALDTTQISALFAETSDLTRCSITPYRDLINYLFFNITPPCVSAYPSGDALMRAWNAQTGSVSFGYQPVQDTVTIQREVAVLNVALTGRSYRVSVEQPTDPGVRVSVSPTAFDLAATSLTTVTLSIQLDAALLSDRDALESALYQVDGTLLIDGGPNSVARVPWHVVPQRVSDLREVRRTESQIVLANTAAVQSGDLSAFALVDLSPNSCDVQVICTNPDYTPGDYPGLRYSPPDLAAIGVRGRSLPGLNQSLGLPPAPAGATPDELVEFAVSLHDLPYRAAPYVPIGFEVTIDSDADAVADYLLSTFDRGDGRVGLQVRDLNPADGVSPLRDVGDAEAGFQTTHWVLGVPAAAVGLRSDQPFGFRVLARDQYFSGDAEDCSPRVAGVCTAYHQFQTGAPAFVVDQSDLRVEPLGRATITYSEDPLGSSASPSQIGLLFLLADNTPATQVLPLHIR